jgi:hypothetical protein
MINSPENINKIINYYNVSSQKYKYNNKSENFKKYIFNIIKKNNIENIILTFKIMHQFNNEIPNNIKKLILAKTIQITNNNKFNNSVIIIFFQIL